MQPRIGSVAACLLLCSIYQHAVSFQLFSSFFFIDETDDTQRLLHTPFDFHLIYDIIC